MKNTKNVLLAGVGGQGTILAAKLLTIGLMEEGFDVKMSEIHGMSQRGGDVTSQVRYSSDKVLSPVIEKGDADLVVAFEEMEALRNLDYLKPDGTVVVNTERIPSMTVLTGAEKYPDDVLSEITGAAAKTITLNATEIATGLGNPKVANIILLGSLIKAMGLTDINWSEIIKDNVKAELVDLNIQALNRGIELVD